MAIDDKSVAIDAVNVTWVDQYWLLMINKWLSMVNKWLLMDNGG